MKIIKNPKLFNELKKIAWLSNFDNGKIWEGLFKDDVGTLKDERIPILSEGLDHIVLTPKSVRFIDIAGDDNKYTGFEIQK